MGLVLQAPFAPTGHFPHKWGKKSLCHNQKPIPPLLAGEVSAKLTEGVRISAFNNKPVEYQTCPFTKHYFLSISR